jgi:predicted ATP-dependent endonuclease of OLD family
MRLSKLILQNIKSFRDKTEIDFSGNLNIFIGPNGGGKSNLMNTLSWVLNSRFYRPFNYQLHNNRPVLQLHNYSDSAPEPHWSNPEAPSFVWIEFEVTEEDLEGMREYWRNKLILKENFKELIFWEGNAGIDKDEVLEEFEKGIVGPDEYGLTSGRKMRYKIAISRERKYTASLAPVDGNDSLIQGEELKICDAYLRYLTDAELRRTLGQEGTQISLPYILYSPFREPHDLTVNMSGGMNIHDVTRNYHNEMQSYAFNNKGSSQILTQISSFVLGVDFVELVYSSGFDNAQQLFRSTESFKKLSKDLEVFGFKWDMHVINKWANIFQIVIAKVQEEEYFAVGQASSGERQLLNFIFGLSSKSIENSLIIIDEPELNLHPRWQKLLLRFFLNVQSEKNSQFVISTHSASFLDERTLPHVRRIFRKDQSSALSSTNSGSAASSALTDAVKLLNAQQNERLFFTQKAVLVEGPSDFVIWQKLINTLLEIFGVGEIIEVIEVLGSANFIKYRAFLDLFEIDSYIVADQDYVMTIGDDYVKNIFKGFFQENKTCQNILKSHSIDRLSLISAIESAVDNGDTNTLRGILEYLKCRNTKINIDEITLDQQRGFEAFQKEQENSKTFVLKKGALEAYYLVPNHEQGDLKRDTDKAIAFASDEIHFKAWMCNGARKIIGETLTVKDRVMADEASEFISIAMKIIGVELTNKNFKTIKLSVCR